MFNRVNLRYIYISLLFLISLSLIFISLQQFSFTNIAFISILFAFLLIVDYFDLFEGENIYFNAGLKIIIVFTYGWSMAALFSSLAVLLIYVLKKRDFDYHVLYLFSKEYVTTAFSGWFLLRMFPTERIYIKPTNALIGASVFIVLFTISEFAINYIHNQFSHLKKQRDNLNWLERSLFISLLSSLFSYISFFFWYNKDYSLLSGSILFSLFFVLLIYMQNKRKSQIEMTFQLASNINSILEDAQI